MQKWQQIALLLAGAVGLFALSALYARQMEALAEIDELERIPVLAQDPQ